MRKTIWLGIVFGIALAAGGGAFAAGAEASPGPVEVTKAFMRGVLDNERSKLEATFDFEFAMNDINAKFEAMGAGRPYDLQQITDTLIVHFTDKEQQKAMSELDAPVVTFAVRFDEKEEKALVAIRKPNARADDVFKTETNVGLAKVGGQWKVQIFPAFYPLDAWKISTGGQG